LFFIIILNNFVAWLDLFDNIFSDIILQNKISVAISDVERTYRKLKRIKKNHEQQIDENKSTLSMFLKNL
jgi:hypothetical protein